MSYPRRKDLFTEWAKAMVEGATVDKPRYRGTKKPTRARKPKSHKRPSTGRRRKKRDIANG